MTDTTDAPTAEAEVNTEVDAVVDSQPTTEAEPEQNTEAAPIPRPFRKPRLFMDAAPSISV